MDPVSNSFNLASAQSWGLCWEKKSRSVCAAWHWTICSWFFESSEAGSICWRISLVTAFRHCHEHSSNRFQHGLEVCDEQLGFWCDRSQPRWALDLFGRWSPWTCIRPNGIQLHGLLSWCSGSTSLWPLPAIHLRWDRAPRWLSSLGPIRPVTAGDTAPKELCELLWWG